MREHVCRGRNLTEGKLVSRERAQLGGSLKLCRAHVPSGQELGWSETRKPMRGGWFRKGAAKVTEVKTSERQNVKEGARSTVV